MSDPAAPLTAGALLFGDEDQAAAALCDAIRSGGVVWSALGSLARATGDAAAQEIAKVTAGLLDVDLAHVLVAGWHKCSALTKAARRTVDAPGSRERVALVTHTVTAEQPLSVELLVDGVRVATIKLELKLEWTVDALTGSLVAGRLVALESGHCHVAGMLTVEGVTVANRAIDSDLRFVVPIGDGIPLVRDAPPLAARPPAPTGSAGAGGWLWPAEAVRVTGDSGRGK
jgi:hypothetical protein